MQIRSSQKSARSREDLFARREPARTWDVRIVMSGLPMQSCSVLLSSGEDHILVDTGFPQHETILLDGLHRAGVEAAQITGLINTHFHLDHIGGNFLFPDAWKHGSRADYEWAVGIYESVCGGETRREVFRTFYPEVSEADFDRMDQARVLQLIRWMWDPGCLGSLDRYRWFEESPLDLEGITIVPTPGHTPDHVSVLVEGTDDRYLILGDARAFQDDNAIGYDMPPWRRTDYDRSRELIGRFEGILIPGHDDPFSHSPEERDPLEEDREDGSLVRQPRHRLQD